MCSAEVPSVILTVSRCGPGIGGIQPGQADYFQATRGGGNGDYMIPVLAPSTVQEGVDLVYEAMELADKWQNPIFIFTDGLLGQMMEPVKLPEPIPAVTSENIRAVKPWAITGYGDDDTKRNTIISLRLQPEVLETHVHKLFTKYEQIKKELVRFETTGLEDAEIVFVAFGTVARVAKESIELLAQMNIKAGLIRPISLRPFPYGAFDLITSKTRVVISAELSMGQMIQDVQLGICDRFPVRLLNRTGGMIPTSLEIAQRAKAILEEVEG